MQANKRNVSFAGFTAQNKNAIFFPNSAATITTVLLSLIQQYKM